ncbi:MAG: hypothetical protein WAK37_18170, partial [Pseudolabrys sp.]
MFLAESVGRMSAIGTKRTSACALHMSAFGGKADIIQGKADIKKCPLMTQSGHWLCTATMVLMPVSAPMEV